MKRSDISTLRELKKLRDDGILTEAEFAKKKRQLLDLKDDVGVPVTRSTLRLVLLSLATFGIYPYHLFFEMRKSLNGEIGKKRTALLHGILFLIPLVNAYPLYRFSRDLRDAHGSVKLRWPIAPWFEWFLIASFVVCGVAVTIVSFYPDPAEAPLWLMLVSLVTLPLALGYFIRLLWSFNDYWRAKLGDRARSALLAPDWLWSYLWLLGVFLIGMIVGIGLFISGLWDTPELDACYNRLDQKAVQVDNLTANVADLQGSGSAAQADALRPTLNLASAEYSQIDAECRRLETEAFGMYAYN